MINGGYIMFFKIEFVAFEILDIFELNQKNIKAITHARPFNALSFRYNADTHILTKNKNYYLKDNTVVFVPANFEYVRESVVDRLIVVHFNIFKGEFKNFEYFSVSGQNSISSLFIQIYNLWKEKNVDYKYKCSALFCKILAECYVQNIERHITPSKIQSSIDFLIKNYQKNITIKQIAEQSFISEVYFRKLFKKEFKTSPQKYINDLRLENAINLIKIEYYSLKEISSMVGFRDYKYFLIQFKKFTGLSPTEYKKKLYIHKKNI